MDFVIRAAAEVDIPRLAALFRRDLGYQSCAEEIVRAQFVRLDPAREAVFVADCCGANPPLAAQVAVGVVHVELYNTLYFPPLANVLGIAVDGAFRGRGAGSALLAAAEQWARARGATAMRVNSGATRTAAHSFYRSRGYSGEKPQFRFFKPLTAAH